MRRLILALSIVATLPVLGVAANRLPTPAHAAGYRPFLGVWHAHGFNLEVTPDGNAYATYRMYVWCSAHRHFGCDHLAGNQIFDGGVWSARLAVRGTVQARGIIDAAADSTLDGTGFVLRRQAGDFLMMTWFQRGQKRQLTLCGPHVPVPTNKCGA